MDYEGMQDDLKKIEELVRDNYSEIVNGLSDDQLKKSIMDMIANDVYDKFFAGKLEFEDPVSKQQHIEYIKEHVVKEKFPMFL